MSDRVYRELWQTIGSGREWRGELRKSQEERRLYWECVSISPLLDADGKVTHFLAVKEDTTRRREADETLRGPSNKSNVSTLAIGRERRIIELKAAINELLARLGEPPRYQVAPQPAPSARARHGGDADMMTFAVPFGVAGSLPGSPRTTLVLCCVVVGLGLALLILGALMLRWRRRGCMACRY
jgi:hypothetical protein